MDTETSGDTFLPFRVAGAITVDVKIPKEGELGKSVKLECTWKLTGNSTLYTVKWYKNEYEFFTYNPDNRPQITLHEQNGVNIDSANESSSLDKGKWSLHKLPSRGLEPLQVTNLNEELLLLNNNDNQNYSNKENIATEISIQSPKVSFRKSNILTESNLGNVRDTQSLNDSDIKMKHSTKNEVRLTGLSLNSTGQYKCEVSTGSPFFATNYRQGNLTVISLPSQGPEITGLSGHYTLGENVTANCTSWPSVPKARIHWTVNNKSVLLLESGDEEPKITDIPGFFWALPNSSIDYNYRLQRDPEICKGSIAACSCPRGHCMGGSSSINALVYNRGNKEDFNDWAKAGNPGWSWNDVLPYFKKSENLQQVSPEYVVQYPPLEPIYSQGTPNSLGLRFQLDSHHLYGSDGMLRVRCVAHVGSRRFETERHVQLGRANNQRITAGDLRSGGMTIAATHSAICIVILTVFLAT